MKKDLISIDDLRLDEILDYLELAAKVEAIPDAEKAGMLPGKILVADRRGNRRRKCFVH